MKKMKKCKFCNTKLNKKKILIILKKANQKAYSIIALGVKFLLILKLVKRKFILKI